MTLKFGFEVTQVIETGTIQKLGCDFLFAFYSNYGDILYRLRDIATYWSKIGKFLYPPVFSAPAGGWPRRNYVNMLDAGKTRMIGLPYGEKTVTIY